jgi:hypothetical protein
VWEAADVGVWVVIGGFGSPSGRPEADLEVSLFLSVEVAHLLFESEFFGFFLEVFADHEVEALTEEAHHRAMEPRGWVEGAEGAGVMEGEPRGGCEIDEDTGDLVAFGGEESAITPRMMEYDIGCFFLDGMGKSVIEGGDTGSKEVFPDEEGAAKGGEVAEGVEIVFGCPCVAEGEGVEAEGGGLLDAVRR